VSLVLGGQSVAPLFRRLGPVFAIAGAAVAMLTWPLFFDLSAYLDAARLVSIGQDPYAATRAAGVDQWGQYQVFLSPPFVAHVLAPFVALPVAITFIGWTVASLAGLLAAMRAVTAETLVAKAPLVVFSFVYVWGSLWMGQVNLFTLAGLLLAFGARSHRLAGFGLALAIVTRALPGAFLVVFVVDRRWRAIGWTALFVGLCILIRPSDWIAYMSILREASGLPTLPVLVQTSLAPWPLLWLGTAIVIAAIVIVSALVNRDRVVLAGTAIGFAIVLLPSNAWHHWLSFALAPLLLYGDATTWGRRALLMFVVVSFLPIGVLSSGVAVVTLLAMLVASARNLRDAWPLFRPRAVGILGPP
jgi:hypothetical protein